MEPARLELVESVRLACSQRFRRLPRLKLVVVIVWLRLYFGFLRCQTCSDTALSIAARLGYTIIVKLLIMQGANINHQVGGSVRATAMVIVISSSDHLFLKSP